MGEAVIVNLIEDHGIDRRVFHCPSVSTSTSSAIFPIEKVIYNCPYMADFLPHIVD